MFAINYLCQKRLKVTCLKQFRLVYFSRRWNLITIDDVCEVGNGLVSGLDKAFKLDNIDTLNDLEFKSTLDILKGFMPVIIFIASRACILPIILGNMPSTPASEHVSPPLTVPGNSSE